jgi:hypothetical protein
MNFDHLLRHYQDDMANDGDFLLMADSVIIKALHLALPAYKRPLLPWRSLDCSIDLLCLLLASFAQWRQSAISYGKK